ncbi:MAG: DUF4157 domain-containing protein [Leptospirales bacterium]
MSHYQRTHKKGSSAEKKSSSSKTSTTSSPSRQFTPSLNFSSRNYIMHLQRTIGNQAVGQLVKSGWLQRKLQQMQQPLRLPPGFGTNVQTKLNIGPPNDKYEQEADTMAEKVVSMDRPQIGSDDRVGNSAPEESQQIFRTTLADSITPLQREKKKFEEEGVQKAPVKEDEKLKGKFVQRENFSGNAPPGVESSINSAKGGGRSLSPGERSYYEPRFGTSFAGVKIHTDSKAAQLSRSVNARAFTVGRDVFFGAGQYSPNTVQGKRLMAHELTHTVQQNNSRSAVFRSYNQFCQNTNFSIQRQVKDARKNCREWRFKQIPKEIAHIKQQEYRYLSHKNTYEPIPDKYTMTPVYKYVWNIHNYKVVRCNYFNTKGKKVNQLIGFYYRSSVDGKFIAYKKSKPWFIAYTLEYNRLKRKPK